jgi:beta-glucosidase
LSELKLPEAFVLGAATSAYQIEGAWNTDGKGPSIWDTFTALPGRTEGDVSGRDGVDHYHRYAEDIRHMQAIGLDSYRFSVSWPRLLPDGIGQVNEAGAAFYDRLIDDLLAAGIKPNVTLYHWDLPQALQDRGGWPNRDVIDWFEEYAAVAFDRYGDRVPLWATLNEPIALWVGYGLGLFAPGIADRKLGKQAMHNAMVAHGRAVRQFRASGASGEIGIAIDVWRRHPATDSEADQALALREEDDSFRFFFDELFTGGWSPRLQNRLEEEGLTPAVEPDDFALAAEPIDFLGLNVYSRVIVDAQNFNPHWWTTPEENQLPGGNYLANGQEFYPRALSDAARVVRTEYGVSVPVYITENGLSARDEALVDGQVHDADRIAYLTGFLRDAVRAVTEGLDIRGYYVWSLLDNYEWTASYTARFGLIRVDAADMNRVWKDSAHWFQRLCGTRTLAVDTEGMPVDGRSR